MADTKKPQTSKPAGGTKAGDKGGKMGNKSGAKKGK